MVQLWQMKYGNWLMNYIGVHLRMKGIWSCQTMKRLLP